MVSLGIHLATMELIHTFYKRPEDVYFDSPKWLQHFMKPLFYCPTCMASIWGTIWHFYFEGSIDFWIPVVFAVSFVNTLFAKWTN